MGTGRFDPREFEEEGPPPKKISCRGLLIAGVVAVIGLRILASILVSAMASLTSFTAADMKLRDLSRGKFQVELPGQPSLRNARTRQNDRITGYHLSRGGWEFMVEFFDIPDNKTFGDQAQAAARSNVQGVMKGLDLTPVGELEDITHQDEPGAEQAFTGSEGDGIMRVIIREDYRVYVLLCSSRKFDPVIARRFLDSFNMYE